MPEKSVVVRIFPVSSAPAQVATDHPHKGVHLRPLLSVPFSPDDLFDDLFDTRSLMINNDTGDIILIKIITISVIII